MVVSVQVFTYHLHLHYSIIVHMVYVVLTFKHTEMQSEMDRREKSRLKDGRSLRWTIIDATNCLLNHFVVVLVCIITRDAQMPTWLKEVEWLEQKALRCSLSSSSWPASVHGDGSSSAKEGRSMLLVVELLCGACLHHHHATRRDAQTPTNCTVGPRT